MMDGSADMNISFLQKALLDPMTTIDEIFKETLKSPQINEDAMDATANNGTDLPDIYSFGSKVSSLYADVFEVPELYCSIPYLDKEYFNSGKLAPNSIVRYRGIVQDILNPEFFIGAYLNKNKESGESSWVQSKYRDCIYFDQDEAASFDLDGPGVVTLERQPLILAPIPGENKWVKEFYDEQRNISAGNSSIHIKYDTSMVIDDSCGAENRSELPNLSKRRTMENDDDNCMNVVDSTMYAKKVVSEETSAGNLKSNAMMNDADSIEKRKMGSDDPNGMCCLARATDFKDDDFHLNDAIEVIALYTLDVVVPTSSISGSEEEFAEMEDSMHPLPPPPSLMPRLQILGYRRLDSSYPVLNRVCSTHANERLTENSQFSCRVDSFFVNKSIGFVDLPLKDVCGCLFPSTNNSNDNYEDILAVRKSLVSTLSAILSGQMSFSVGSRNVLPTNLTPRPDADIAAEYLLLALLSRIESRSTSGLLVGSFALNLVGLHSSTEGTGSQRMESLLQFLDSFVPKTVKIDLSIESLNKPGALLPSRDSKTDLICPSPLMSATGTLLMIDESNMSEGTLVDSGLKSFHALRSVVQKQILPIEFDYYSMDMPVENSIILFSDTSSSIFSGDGCIVKVNVHGSEGKQTGTTDGETVNLESFRKYWSCLRLLSTTMDESTAKIVEDDFVTARQQNQKISSDDFHMWLVLCRLLAASYGHSEVTVNTWKKVLDLEKQRKALSSATKRSV